ncbi:hypothetical protein BJ165DRAFT_363803 [Panaeolus papilionaceus]|nr:hypothetical protein BJ165DRAFT_363803 [Panaeolus papilionaceus]
MAMEDLQRTYNSITISQPISVVPSQIPMTFLLMGITGTGKSTFVEKLSSSHQLHISGDTIESVTKEIALYQLICRKPRVRPRRKIFFLDTPGLSDPSISEATVIKTIKAWMAQNGLKRIDRLLYFERINETRLSRSKQDSARIFKELAGNHAAESTCIITSMWDQLQSGKSKTNAEKRFKDLAEGHWKDIIEGGGKILKFENTPESAMDIVAEAFEMHTAVLGFDDSNPIARQIVLAGLIARMEHLQDRQKETQEVIESMGSNSKETHVEFWRNEAKKVDADLKIFARELDEFIRAEEGYGLTTT